MTIQRRASASDSWRTIGTMAIKSVEAESDTYTDVDISGLLNSGTCQLRIIVTGDQTQSTTTYVVFQSVTKTELKLYVPKRMAATYYWCHYVFIIYI